ncbi:neurturin isoform X2 [Columba livia]
MEVDSSGPASPCAAGDRLGGDTELSPLPPPAPRHSLATAHFPFAVQPWVAPCLRASVSLLQTQSGRVEGTSWSRGDAGVPAGADQPQPCGWEGVRVTGEGRVIRIFVLPVLQSFNVLTCSKMKVWKFAAIASMLLSSMLSILVCRDMLNGSRTNSPLPSSPSSSRASSSSSSSSSSLPVAPRRSPRALRRHSSLLAQYSSLLESYTEGEIRQLIAALVERYSQAMNSGGHELPLFPRAGSRRKRARARHKPCALQELEVSVSELGLGYESDETVLFRYCSGTCEAAVRSYDLSLKSMRSRRRIKKEKVRARPCCRPLAYDDDVSFLDAYNRYYTVNELSAKECGCV